MLELPERSKRPLEIAHTKLDDVVRQHLVRGMYGKVVLELMVEDGVIQQPVCAGFLDRKIVR